MKCLAVDDEPLALSIIENFCQKIPFITSLETCSSGVDAIKKMEQNPVDLIFLDINMPHISGLELASILQNPPMIIFTTAYQNHALQGFELSAIDYLVKPFSFNRFLKGVVRAHELYLLRNNQSVALSNSGATLVSLPDTDYIIIKVDSSNIKLELRDIIFIEGLKDYIKIYTVAKNYVTKSTMKNIEEKLPSTMFMRTHKSNIINIDKIERFENNHIHLLGHQLPLGNGYREAFLQFLDKNKI